ncbi:hypothetical protein TWF106_006811 [Orbilia oligospora]|uniref:Uncharacterized protein n=1 Tax=Orbilia oligospora TaxID=2813651 RepID=A0A7C8UKE4_ORBOL|nr:hypothetical protein TWF106_006811 [Orbilia oligospora]
MASSRDLESPFKPQREKHAPIYCKKFKAINDTKLVSNHDKGILLAVLAFKQRKIIQNEFRWTAGDDCSDSSGTVTRRESFSESLARCYRGGMEQTYGTAREWRTYSVGYDENIQTICLGILTSLGLKETFPGIPSKSFSISGATIEDDCILRQQDCCPFFGLGLAGEERTANLFPLSSLDPTNDTTILIWRFLHILLGTANKKYILDELWSEEKGIQTTKNGTSVFSNEYGYFNRGEIALIPVRLTHAQDSYDYLNVQVGLYSAGETVQRTKSFDKFAVGEQYIFRRGEAPGRIFEDPGYYIKDGNIIKITTPDPELLPLPSYVLMYWHRHLWSTLASAGLSRPPHEIAGEDSRDWYLRKRMSAQPLRSNSSDGHHGYEEGRRDGYPVAYTDEDLQTIIDQETRFLDFLYEISVPENDFGGHGTDYSDEM